MKPPVWKWLKWILSPIWDYGHSTGAPVSSVQWSVSSVDCEHCTTHEHFELFQNNTGVWCPKKCSKNFINFGGICNSFLIHYLAGKCENKIHLKTYFVITLYSFTVNHQPGISSFFSKLNPAAVNVVFKIMRNQGLHQRHVVKWCWHLIDHHQLCYYCICIKATMKALICGCPQHIWPHNLTNSPSHSLHTLNSLNRNI